MEKTEHKMKLYQTSQGDIINLEKVSLIQHNEGVVEYTIFFDENVVTDLVLLDEDIERIMEYNNYFIK